MNNMKSQYIAPAMEAVTLQPNSVLASSPSGNEPFNKFTGGSFDE